MLRKHFHLLAALPEGTRSSLLQQLTKVLEEREALSSLQRVVSGTEVTSRMMMMTAVAFKRGSFPLRQLDQVCLDENTSLREVSASESQKQNVHLILELLEQSGQADQLAPALTALNLIVSAMDGKKTL